MTYCAAGTGAGGQAGVPTEAVNVHLPTGQQVAQSGGAGCVVSGTNEPWVVSVAVHCRPFGSGIIDPSSPTPQHAARMNSALIPAKRMTAPVRNGSASAKPADSFDLV